MMLKRKADWPECLHRYLQDVWRLPFEPVQHNCAMFVRGAIMAMTDHDPLDDLGIELPRSAADVGRVLTHFRGVRGLADACLGSRQPVRMARRGDVVLRNADGTDTLGICIGEHAVFLSEDGAQARLLSECEIGWRVPL
jgi:hypothetical protein